MVMFDMMPIALESSNFWDLPRRRNRWQHREAFGLSQESLFHTVVPRFRILHRFLEIMTSTLLLLTPWDGENSCRAKTKAPRSFWMVGSNGELRVKIGNGSVRFGSVRFESVETETFNIFETSTKPNRYQKFKPLKPLTSWFRGSVLVFKLGQNSNFQF